MGQTFGVPPRDDGVTFKDISELRDPDDPEYFMIASWLRHGDCSFSEVNVRKAASDLPSHAPSAHLWRLNPIVEQEAFWMEKKKNETLPIYHLERLWHDGERWTMKWTTLYAKQLAKERDALRMPGSVYYEVP